MSRPVLEKEFRHNGERLLDLLRSQHPDYHPILSIARIAHNCDGDPELLETALKAHSTILKYVEPEIKSVEVNVNRDDGRVIEVSLFSDTKKPEIEADKNVMSLLGVIDVESVAGADR